MQRLGLFFVILISIIFFTSVARSEQPYISQKYVICGSFKELTQVAKEKYEETPFLVWKNDDIDDGVQQTMLLINTGTNTITIIDIFKDDLACVISFGVVIYGPEYTPILRGKKASF